ncbi:transcriptional regulator GcvA [Chitinivorax sp. PXF-14]|uniref:transcriptional regulator GcvA n=1 Tax=Chitinivorax sp. PXF-14 TaxID=3230488 RepID=UPI00346706E0
MSRLPPLNALQVFEVAARHLNLTRAADELHVTQGAVSRQIRMLEAHYGVPLFLRRARGLALTAEGSALLPGVREGFARLAEASAQLAAQCNDIKFRLPPSFAIRWFLPRLERFQAAWPQYQIRMTAAWKNEVDFDREDFDACILYGSGDWRGMHLTRLFAERMTPLCSPAVAARLRQPTELAGETLLHPSEDHVDWRNWLTLAGADSIDVARGQSFDTLDQAMNAAAQGYGVAIGDLALCADDLAAGRLVAPFPLVLDKGLGYYLACRPAQAEHPKLAALRQWLGDEGRREGPATP